MLLGLPARSVIVKQIEIKVTTVHNNENDYVYIDYEALFSLV